jgi:hypothetical protein
MFWKNYLFVLLINKKLQWCCDACDVLKKDLIHLIVFLKTNGMFSLGNPTWVCKSEFDFQTREILRG